MDLSIFLGQVFSIYFLVMGLALFLNKGEMLKAAREFVGANASFVFYGAIALILGLLVIFSHSIWDKSVAYSASQVLCVEEWFSGLSPG